MYQIITSPTNNRVIMRSSSYFFRNIVTVVDTVHIVVHIFFNEFEEPFVDLIGFE